MQLEDPRVIDFFKARHKPLSETAFKPLLRLDELCEGDEVLVEKPDLRFSFVKLGSFRVSDEQATATRGFYVGGRYDPSTETVFGRESTSYKFPNPSAPTPFEITRLQVDQGKVYRWAGEKRG